MKKLNPNQVLVALDGTKLVEGSTEITVGLIISNTLSGNVNNPHRAYQLAKQIATEKTVELKAEEIVYIKEALLKSTLGALYIGQCIDILESSDTK